MSRGGWAYMTVRGGSRGQGGVERWQRAVCSAARTADWLSVGLVWLVRCLDVFRTVDRYPPGLPHAYSTALSTPPSRRERTPSPPLVFTLSPTPSNNPLATPSPSAQPFLPRTLATHTSICASALLRDHLHPATTLNTPFEPIPCDRENTGRKKESAPPPNEGKKMR